MSKVVKKVGKAIGKVVKGVVKGVKKVVKKIAKSKVFKVIATAALIYFGGAALMGGFSSLSAGGSFLQGMGTGISNAWSGVTGAFSSGSFSKAGAQLAAGAKGQAINTTTGTITSAGGKVVGTSQAFAPAATGGVPTNVVASGAGSGGINATGINTTALPSQSTPLSSAQGFTSPLSNVPQVQTNFVGQAAQTGANVNTALGQAGMAPVGGQVTVPGVVPPGGGFTTGASNATLNQMAINSAQGTLTNTAGLTNTAPQAAGFFSDPLVKYGAMTVGGGLLSGYAQGRAAENIERQRREDEAAALLAYNENVGTVIGMPVYNPSTGQYEYSNQANAGG